MGIRHIQQILGHEKASSTEVYGKVTLTGLKAYRSKHFRKERSGPRKTRRAAKWTACPRKKTALPVVFLRSPTGPRT